MYICWMWSRVSLTEFSFLHVKKMKFTFNSKTFVYFILMVNVPNLHKIKINPKKYFKMKFIIATDWKRCKFVYVLKQLNNIKRKKGNATRKWIQNKKVVYISNFNKYGKWHSVTASIREMLKFKIRMNFMRLLCVFVFICKWHLCESSSVLNSCKHIASKLQLFFSRISIFRYCVAFACGFYKQKFVFVINSILC